MKTLQWLCLSAVILLQMPCSAEWTLKAMTFNIRLGTALDGPNAWPHRKDILVNCIRSRDPDLIGLQECYAFQAEYIASQLPEYRWIGVGRDADGTGEMTAVFYRHRTIMPLESGHFWLSEQPESPGSVSWDSSLTRMVTWLYCYYPETRSRFYFYNTHLDHRGREARRQSIDVIAEHTRRVPEAVPLVLVGDFNAVAGESPPYERALELGLRDAWTEAETREGPTVTFSSFAPPDLTQDARIDWILVRGPVRVAHCETVTYHEDGRYPSDHYPVFAVLHLDAKE